MKRATASKLGVPLIVILPAILFCFCKPATEETYTGDAEFEVMDRFWLGFDEKNPDVWTGLMDQETRLFGPGIVDSINGAEFIQEWRIAFENDIDSLVYTRTARRYLPVTIEENPILAGNWVMDWGTVQISFKDSTSANFWWHGVFRIANKKINLVRFFYDNGDIYRQRGYSLTSPGGMDINPGNSALKLDQ